MWLAFWLCLGATVGICCAIIKIANDSLGDK